MDKRSRNSYYVFFIFIYAPSRLEQGRAAAFLQTWGWKPHSMDEATGGRKEPGAMETCLSNYTNAGQIAFALLDA